jgi:hypothetical protein
MDALQATSSVTSGPGAGFFTPAQPDAAQKSVIAARPPAPPPNQPVLAPAQMATYRRPTPVETLLEGIRYRQALVAKAPEDFPLATRAGNISAQVEARDALVTMESAYAEYFKQAVVAGIVLGSPADTQTFVAASEAACVQPLVVVDAGEMYTRLAKAGEPGLGTTRTFGSGQMGLIIEEMAAIGRSLFFSSLASPRWSYDVLVPTTADLALVIRTAIRGGEDGDELNRAYLRMSAYRKALDTGYTTAMIPVLVVGSIPEEVEVFTKKLFNASVLVDLQKSPPPGAEAVLKKMFDIKSRQGIAATLAHQ